jgi:hypothetical protein
MRHPLAAGLLLALLLAPTPSAEQDTQAARLAELIALGGRMGAADTRVRVDATHRAWTIALAANDSQTKATAIGLLREPIGSSSDHIRMPAIYAVVEIAGSTDDPVVKAEALGALAEAMAAGQVPIRDVAIDAVNLIVAGTSDPALALAAVRALAPAVGSGNNGVRIPAIHALVGAVRHGGGDRACEAALDALAGPLDSSAAIGGMEVRMMAVAAVERIGIHAEGVGTKARAMGLLQACAADDGWEPEARARATAGAAAIQARIR